MGLKIDRRDVDGVTVLHLSGELISGEESGSLEKTFKDLIAGGNRRLLLDLEGISHIDSAGLGTLGGICGTMRKRRGTVKLLSLTDRVRMLLEITRLITIFDVFDNQEEAIKSFRN